MYNAKLVIFTDIIRQLNFEQKTYDETKNLV